MTEKPLSARLRELLEQYQQALSDGGHRKEWLVERHILALLPAIMAKLEEAEQYVAIQRMEM